MGLLAGPISHKIHVVKADGEVLQQSQLGEELFLDQGHSKSETGQPKESSKSGLCGTGDKECFSFCRAFPKQFLPGTS